MTLKTQTAERALRTDLASGFLCSLEKHDAEEKDSSKPQARPDFASLLLTDAARTRTSDIHLEPRSDGTRIRFRIDRVVWDAAHLTHDQGKLLINQFKAMANLDPIVRFTPKDAHASFPMLESKLDMRLAVTPTSCGEALSIRLLDSKRLERSLDNLGLSNEDFLQLQEWLDSVNGMFLATGPTGSGKTTTVYSLLNEFKWTDRIIVSLEDPVEYQIDGITQVQLDEKHHLDFASGVRSMLRFDPDFVMLGEIRDAASAHAAVNAAISGRILLSTVHCRDAVGAIGALRNWDLLDHEIAESLSVVVSQRLVRKLCRECREECSPSSAEIDWLRALKLSIPNRVWRPKGCKQCQKIGYYGLIGVFELWCLSANEFQLIRNHADEHTIREELTKRKHRTFLDDALGKAADGTTSLSELKRISGFSSLSLKFG